MNGLPDLKAWLAAHSAAGDVLALPRVEVKALLDELNRLQQSNDMLRKQNRKVRGKVARLKADDGVEDGGDGGGTDGGGTDGGGD